MPQLVFDAISLKESEPASQILSFAASLFLPQGCTRALSLSVPLVCSHLNCGKCDDGNTHLLNLNEATDWIDTLSSISSLLSVLHIHLLHKKLRLSFHPLPDDLSFHVSSYLDQVLALFLPRRRLPGLRLLAE